jgi:hypothetical protein
MSGKQPHDGSPSKAAKNAAYEVGYGKPPRARQFKAGQSGNPKGRPKGAMSEARILRELLHRKLDVRQNGRSRKITVFEAILLRFTEDALKGNTKTAAFLFNRYAAGQAGEPHINDDIGEDDRQVLEAFARRFETQHTNKKERP